MARRLVVQPQSDLDIQTAAVWYEDQQAGLSARFLDELGLVFRAHPGESTPISTVGRTSPSCASPSLPYGVYFFAESEEVKVLAVLHLHRQPDMWKRRN